MSYRRDRDTEEELEIIELGPTFKYMVDVAKFMYTESTDGRYNILQYICPVTSLPPPCLVKIGKFLENVSYGDPFKASVVISGDGGKTFRESAGSVKVGDSIFWNKTVIGTDAYIHRKVTLEYNYDSRTKDQG